MRSEGEDKLMKLKCPECECEYLPKPQAAIDKGAKPTTHCPICEVELQEVIE